MKISKRHILLIILSVFPFYRIIHSGDYCINDVDYLLVALMSIPVLITFLAIVFFNLYNITLQKEFFNFIPLIIFGIFLISLYVVLKFPDISNFKTKTTQLFIKSDTISTSRIILYENGEFQFKNATSNEFCVNYGNYFFKEDSLHLQSTQNTNKYKFLDSVYFFDRKHKMIRPKNNKLPNFLLQED